VTAEEEIWGIPPSKLHQRLALFMGSPEDMQELMSYEDVQQLDGKTYTVYCVTCTLHGVAIGRTAGGGGGGGEAFGVPAAAFVHGVPCGVTGSWGDRSPEDMQELMSYADVQHLDGRTYHL
jgi:hypothetical protein